MLSDPLFWLLALPVVIVLLPVVEVLAEALFGVFPWRDRP